MDVKIYDVFSGDMVDAILREARYTELPSLQDGWTFNFNKLAAKIKNSQAFILVTKENPEQIEGCMIFELKNKEIPYMAYVEVAPGNFGSGKTYDRVAGCLIAQAFRLSLVKGKNEYKGMLFFDVSEECEDRQLKLLQVYSTSYLAKHIPGTRGTMLIYDEAGEALVNKYLPNYF